MYKIIPIAKIHNQQVKDLIIKTMTDFSCVGPGFSIEDDELNHMYESYNKTGHYFVIVINDANEVYGCAGLASLDGVPNTCELKKMYFKDELRGKGFGSLVLEQLLNFAKNHYTSCYIETMNSMDQAQSLYTKNGFNKIKNPIGNTGHHKCDTYYIKQLV
jgi:putative acetyltransferase